jgi:hypothetical protein
MEQPEVLQFALQAAERIIQRMTSVANFNAIDHISFLDVLSRESKRAIEVVAADVDQPNSNVSLEQHITNLSDALMDGIEQKIAAATPQVEEATEIPVDLDVD